VLTYLPINQDLTYIIIEEYYAKDDLTRTPKGGGRGQFRRSTADKVKRMLGGRPLEEARALKAIWQMTMVEKSAKDSIDVLLDTAAWAIENDEDIPDWMYDKANDDFNVSDRDFNRRAENRADKLSEDWLEQWTNFERTRKGQERAEEIEKRGITVP